MILKFLENKINFNELKSIASTFAQKTKKHENFVFGTITAANAVTIPLAHLFSDTVTKFFIVKTTTFYGKQRIIDDKTLKFFETPCSKMIDFTLFGSIIFIVNKYVISKLLNQSHTKWVLLGTMALSYLRFQNQSINNLTFQSHEFKNNLYQMNTDLTIQMNELNVIIKEINKNLQIASLDFANKLNQMNSDLKNETKTNLIIALNKIDEKTNDQLLEINQLKKSIENDKTQTRKDTKEKLEKLVENFNKTITKTNKKIEQLKNDSITQDQLADTQSQFSDVLNKIAQLETQLNSVKDQTNTLEKIQKKSSVERLQNNNNNNNNSPKKPKKTISK